MLALNSILIATNYSTNTSGLLANQQYLSFMVRKEKSPCVYPRGRSRLWLVLLASSAAGCEVQSNTGYSRSGLQLSIFRVNLCLAKALSA